MRRALGLSEGEIARAMEALINVDLFIKFVYIFFFKRRHIKFFIMRYIIGSITLASLYEIIYNFIIIL